jgi:hypothetical protein
MKITDVLTAIIGLVGVAIGGLITALSSYLIERRRDRKFSERNEQNEVRKVRQAARLVDKELAQAEITAQTAIARRKWWAAEIGLLELNAWHEYRDVLALELSDDEWRTVAAAADFVFGINAAREMAARKDVSSPLAPDMSQEDVGKIPFGIKGISKGRAILADVLQKNGD